MVLILTLIYIAMILAVLLIERKNPTEGLLWVFILICLPGLGMILYLIFGNTMSIKITTFIRKRRLAKYNHKTSNVNISDIPKSNISDEDAQVIQFNSIYNHAQLTSYDTNHIFVWGKDHYHQLFEDIKNAKECIYIEFYSIHNDIIGQALIKALTEKALQGVTVFVLCDFFANLQTPNRMFQPLRDAGGYVTRIKPFFTHFRSHRKLVVIDHSISYIGGMNIGKQYAGFDKIKNPWRDTQIRLTGSCCAILDEYFLSDWLCNAKKRHWNTMTSYIEQLPQKRYYASNNLCQFVVGGVENDKEGIKMCYLSMIRSAKRKIRIQTPYFIPDASILDALKTALISGVDIELMIPGVKASFFLDPVTNYYSGQLLQFGAKVYKYNGYIHAKTMIIDDEICCIGSVNLDMRSLKVDDEICGIFYANELVKQYSAIFDQDITHTHMYTYTNYLNRSAFEKIETSIFVLFAPLM